MDTPLTARARELIDEAVLISERIADYSTTIDEVYALVSLVAGSMIRAAPDRAAAFMELCELIAQIAKVKTVIRETPAPGTETRQ